MMHCIYDRRVYIFRIVLACSMRRKVYLQSSYLYIRDIHLSILLAQHMCTTLTLSLCINVGIGNGIFSRTIGTTTQYSYYTYKYIQRYIFTIHICVYTYIIYIYMATHSAQKLTSKSCFPVQILRQKSMYLCLDTMWIAWKYISSYKRLYNKVYFIGRQSIYNMYRCIYSIHMFGIGNMDIYTILHICMHFVYSVRMQLADNSMRSDSCSTQMKSHDPPSMIHFIIFIQIYIKKYFSPT